MKAIYWGTYDKGKPRNRILIRGLRENGVEVTECHRGIWEGIEDKSQIRGYVSKLLIVVRWLLSYPKLIIQYLRLPPHQVVIVGYLGHFDVLVLWPFAKIKKQPIVWDAFISLYDTVVCDRKLLRRVNPVSKILFYFEWLACRAADKLILDTETHAIYFRETYSLPAQKCHSVFVGVETDQFPQVEVNTVEVNKEKDFFNVLFYGQFIPLHGIETIVRAAALLRDEQEIRWTLIGTGQEKFRIERIMDEVSLPQLHHVDWVNYDDLKSYIHNADICLGIFGISGKASRVIPNKVFQIVSCGKTIITRDSRAIRELLNVNDKGVFLTTAGDPISLAKIVKYIFNNQINLRDEPFFSDKRSLISPSGVGEEFKKVLQSLL